MESEKKSKKRGRKTCHAEHSADLAAQALRCLPVVSAQLSAAAPRAHQSWGSMLRGAYIKILKAFVKGCQTCRQKCCQKPWRKMRKILERVLQKVLLWLWFRRSLHHDATHDATAWDLGFVRSSVNAPNGQGSGCVATGPPFLPYGVALPPEPHSCEECGINVKKTLGGNDICVDSKLISFPATDRWTFHFRALIVFLHKFK